MAKLVGTESITELIQVLFVNNPEVRGAAAFILGSKGSAATEAIPALGDRLRDADQFVRIQAAVALVRIDPSGLGRDPAVIQILSAALTVNDKRERRASACALLSINAHVEQAASVILHEVGDYHTATQDAVELSRSALAAIRPAIADTRVMPLLEAAASGALVDDEDVVRTAGQLVQAILSKTK